MSIADYVRQGIIKRGYEPHIADAFVLNMDDESGLDPGINEASPLVSGSRGGFGLYQLTGPRRRAYEAFAKERGDSLDDIDAQLDFLDLELKGPEASAAKSILSARTTGEAAAAIVNKFLRPSESHRKRREAKYLGGTYTAPSGADVLIGGEGDDQLAEPVAQPEYFTPAQILGMADTQPTPTADEQQDVVPVGDTSVAEAYFTPAQILEMAGQQESAPLVPFPSDDPSAPPAEQPFFDITADLTQDSRDLLGATGPSIMGRGPSVAAQMLPENTFGRETIGRVLDVPLSIAGFGELAYTGLVGGIADAAEGLGASSNTSGRFARDMAALPEAFAGSPSAIGVGAPLGFGNRAATVARVTPDAPDAPRIPQAAAAAVDDVLDAPAPPVSDTQVRDLVALAARGNKGAREKIAEMAKFNPEAAAAAERLQMELPLDILADDATIKSVTGSLRSISNSEDALEWGNTFQEAQRRAAQVMRDAGATGDLSTEVETVRRSLIDSIDGLRAKAAPVYDEIKEGIPKSAQVRPSNSVKLINEIAEELGGTSRFKGPVKELFKAITNDEGMTYGALDLEMRQIAQGVFKNKGIYQNIDEATGKRVWAALKDDQRAFVEATSGADAVKKLDAANDMWTQAKGLEDKLTAGFGKDAEGSIASKLKSAITQGSKGDVKALKAVLDIVPENLRQSTVMTALEDMTTRGGSQGGFSFKNFTTTYEGLRKNGQAYKPIADALGRDADVLLRDLYGVAKRVARAEDSISHTGKSNQPLLAEGLIGSILDSSAGRLARGAVAGATTTAATGGNGLLGSMAAVTASQGKLGKTRAQAASKLLRDDRTKDMAAEFQRTGGVSEKTRKRVTNSPAFRQWASINKIENPDAWLLSAIAASATPQASEIENAR